MREKKDNFSKADSMAVAKVLREYWLKRGYTIKIRAVPLTLDPALKGNKQTSGWTIKTDMINGLPRELCLKNTQAAKSQQGVRRRA